MSIDDARERLSTRLIDLKLAQLSGDSGRIQRAQEAVERAEKVLVEVTLRDEGGWKP